jgi:peroxiredoxin
MTLRPALLASCVALSLAVGCDKPKPGPDSPQADASGKAAKSEGDAKAESKAAPTATAALGQPAPDFTLTDLDGKPHTLSQYQGKVVVLEWWNPQCPFVDYAHGKGPLVDMAANEMAQGVVWLSINSGAPGKQGAGAEASRDGVARFGMKNPVLLDEDGTVGRTYGAEKTPHMFVVDAKGTLVYRGGLDDAPMGEPEDGELTAHVTNALAELRAGKPVTVAETKAYGCSVKYAKG